MALAAIAEVFRVGQSEGRMSAIDELYDAVLARDVPTITRLLHAGLRADVAHRYKEGSLLHHAVCDPVEMRVVELLLDHGAVLDACHPETGGTPLHQLLHASLSLAKKLEVLDLFLARGADINAVAEDRDGQMYTAVDIAASGGVPMAALLEALVARGGRRAPENAML